MAFLSVGRSVCLTSVYCGKIDDLIEPPFGVLIVVGPVNPILDRRAHWRHVANTVERLRAAADCKWV